MISYGKQSISKEDIEAVVSVLQSDFLTQGPKVVEFEREICDYTGAKYCVAVANGTAALHLAVLALDIPSGCRGITSTNTFTASASSMIYAGINVDFADIDKKTYNISKSSIKSVIDKETKLIIPVHFAGQPCDMSEISTLAKDYKLKIIEDAAHAIGSSYKDGSKVGCCKFSELTTFSFHPVKTITTGEGGAITTNDERLYQRLLMLRSHGITKEPTLLKENPGPWYYEMQSLGFNYRLTDIQAALGIVQLKKIKKFKRRRRELVQRYNSAFSNVEWLTVPFEDEKLSSCFHLYVLLIDFVKIGKNRKDAMNLLKEKGIGTQVHYIPVHTQPFYSEFGNWDCKNAIEYYNKALSIPLYPDMTNEMQEYVIDMILDLNLKP